MWLTAPDGNPLTATAIRITEIPDPQEPPEIHGFSRMEVRGAVVDSLAFENMVMESNESTLFTVFLPAVLRQ
jgi:hypothetical protein